MSIHPSAIFRHTARAGMQWAVFPLLLIGCCLFLQVFGSRSNFQFESTLIVQQAEYWRLLSAHFIHLNLTHLGLNMAGLIMTWILFGSCMSPRRWWVVTFVSALALSLMLLIFNSDVSNFVGFSGVLHGLFATGCCLIWQRDRFLSVLAGVALTAKLTYEQSVGPLHFSSNMMDGLVVVDAHLFGAVSGLACAIYFVVRHASLQRRKATAH